MFYQKFSEGGATNLKPQASFSWRTSQKSSLLLFATLMLTACSSVIPTAMMPPITEVTLPEQPSMTFQPPTQVATPSEIQVQPEATGAAQTPDILPELDCSAVLDPTPATTEGPYYTADTPERTSMIEQGVVGTKLILTGYVLGTDCTPIPGAWLDFWQADGNGQYDNTGYRLRGHQLTGEDGRYYLDTVIPGLYPGRPPHIHVKVQAPNQPVLTTQLYFPGEASNQGDSFFFPELLVTMQETEQGVTATFNFVLEIQ